MEKEKIALLSAKRYLSAITGYEEDPYLAEDAADYRRETIEYIEKISNKEIKLEILKIVKKADVFLIKNKKNIIERLSAISDMYKEDIEYLENIKNQ